MYQAAFKSTTMFLPLAGDVQEAQEAERAAAAEAADAAVAAAAAAAESAAATAAAGAGASGVGASAGAADSSAPKEGVPASAAGQVAGAAAAAADAAAAGAGVGDGGIPTALPGLAAAQAATGLQPQPGPPPPAQPSSGQLAVAGSDSGTATGDIGQEAPLAGAAAEAEAEAVRPHSPGHPGMAPAAARAPRRMPEPRPEAIIRSLLDDMTMLTERYGRVAAAVAVLRSGAGGPPGGSSGPLQPAAGDGPRDVAGGEAGSAFEAAPLPLAGEVFAGPELPSPVEGVDCGGQEAQQQQLVAVPPAAAAAAGGAVGLTPPGQGLPEAAEAFEPATGVQGGDVGDAGARQQLAALTTGDLAALEPWLAAQLAIGSGAAAEPPSAMAAPAAGEQAMTPLTAAPAAAPKVWTPQVFRAAVAKMRLREAQVAEAQQAGQALPPMQQWQGMLPAVLGLHAALQQLLQLSAGARAAAATAAATAVPAPRAALPGELASGAPAAASLAELGPLPSPQLPEGGTRPPDDDCNLGAAAGSAVAGPAPLALSITPLTSEGGCQAEEVPLVQGLVLRGALPLLPGLPLLATRQAITPFPPSAFLPDTAAAPAEGQAATGVPAAPDTPQPGGSNTLAAAAGGQEQAGAAAAGPGVALAPAMPLGPATPAAVPAAQDATSALLAAAMASLDPLPLLSSLTRRALNATLHSWLLQLLLAGGVPVLWPELWAVSEAASAAAAAVAARRGGGLKRSLFPGASSSWVLGEAGVSESPLDEVAANRSGF